MLKIWLDKLVEFWKSKNVFEILKLFADDVEYYETPFVTVENIETAWKEIEQQNIKSLSYKLLTTEGNSFVVEFLIDYGDDICSAINHIKLNEDGKCYYLKQWFMCDKDNY